MTRTIALVAVFSLGLLSLVFVSTGSAPEATGAISPAPVAQPTAPERERAGLERTHRAGAASVGTPVLPVTQRVPGLQVGPVLHASFSPVRPQMRGFSATGPLVARLTDPTFGPAARPADLLVPDPPARLTGASDLLCMAVAIYHEARGESLDGQLAVASVILNRTEEPVRWGATPCEVVVPVQFSFLAADGSYPAIPKDETWAIAVEMAREALERGPSALVGEADHYHTPAVDPAWDQAMDQVVQIEDHIFFVDPQPQG